VSERPLEHFLTVQRWKPLWLSDGAKTGGRPSVASSGVSAEMLSKHEGD
jgi:hypothetical protein